MKAKAEKKKAAPPAEPKGGAFSLGAESLEEFFGLTKKPRLVRDRGTMYLPYHVVAFCDDFRTRSSVLFSLFSLFRSNVFRAIARCVLDLSDACRTTDERLSGDTPSALSVK